LDQAQDRAPRCLDAAGLIFNHCQPEAATVIVEGGECLCHSFVQVHRSPVFLKPTTVLVELGSVDDCAPP
jgi:hypothetical protein